MTKMLMAVAISAALAAPFSALADDNATMWPDKAKPERGRTAQQKARGTSRADQAMSGNSAAASGATRPPYDDATLRPVPPRRRAGDDEPVKQAEPKGK